MGFVGVAAVPDFAQYITRFNQRTRNHLETPGTQMGEQYIERTAAQQHMIARHIGAIHLRYAQVRQAINSSHHFATAGSKDSGSVNGISSGSFRPQATCAQAEAAELHDVDGVSLATESPGARVCCIKYGQVGIDEPV